MPIDVHTERTGVVTALSSAYNAAAEPR